MVHMGHRRYGTLIIRLGSCLTYDGQGWAIISYPITYDSWAMSCHR
jgi:hypothetical protein